MEVANFNIKFPYNGQLINAECQVIKPRPHYQFRIVLQEENGRDVVLVMHKIDRPNQTFFWFPVGEQKEKLSQSIAKVGKRLPLLVL